MVQYPRIWGVLPVAIALSVWIVACSGRALRADGGRVERWLAGMTVHCTWTVIGVHGLAALGVLGSWSFLAWLLLGGGVAQWLARGKRPADATEAPLVDPHTWPLLLVGAAASVLLLGCVLLLPVWQWDSLGYHLPVVNFLLQRGQLADLPPDIAFLSTYPRNVEYYFTAVRAVLPDDTLVDGAQLPFGIMAALAIARLTELMGGKTAHGVAAGVAFVTIPAVLLQLPTNYIDMACAAWLLTAMVWALSACNRVHLALCALALGLFLGSKSNAPFGTLLVGGVLLVRHLRAGERLGIVAFGAVVLALGAEAYVVNLVRHGNPIWPVTLHAGPVHFPGTVTMQQLLGAGAMVPRVHGPLPWRLLVSWCTPFANPIFDMRYGGLSPLFVLALPPFVYVAYTKRCWAALPLALAAVASPDPAIPRYILALPGLALAFAVVPLREVAPRWTRAVLGVTAALCVWNLVYATPGLRGDGPPLSAYWSMSADERARAVWAESPVDEWFAAREPLGADAHAAYDYSMELPYLLWKPGLENRVFRIPDRASPDEVGRFLAEHDIHLLVAGDDEPAGAHVRANPGSFRFLFRCPLRQCAVYSL